MKPKEYVSKFKFPYGMQLHASREEFLLDITKDFNALIETNKNVMNKTIFHNCVKNIRDKWDRVFVLGKLHPREKMWGYFYATVVIPAKKSFLEGTKQK